MTRSAAVARLVTAEKVSALATAACMSGVISLFAVGAGLPHLVTLGLWAYGTYTLYPSIRGGQEARKAEQKAHEAARQLERELWERMTRRMTK